MSKKLLSCFIISIAAAFASFTQLQAATLSVTPTTNYLALDAGDTEILDYTLTNDADRDVSVRLEGVSFTSDGVSGQPQLLPQLEFPYFQMLLDNEPQETVTVPAGSNLDVQVAVAPPLGLEVKEYPLTLLFTVTEPMPDANSGADIGLQVGSNLIVRLDSSGNDLSQLQLHLDMPTTLFLDSFQDYTLQIKVNNAGPFGTLIDGNLELQKGGTAKKHWDFYRDLVLGNSSRLARGKDSDLDIQGINAYATDFVLPRFLVGSYQLKAQVGSLLSETETPSDTVTINIIALPYWLILLLAIIIIIAIIITCVSRRKNPRRTLKKRVSKMKQQRRFFSSK